MSYLFVYFKKVTNFAARYSMNDNIKISIYNEKNISTLEQKEKEQTRIP